MRKGVLSVLSTVAGITIGAICVGYISRKEITLQKSKVDKFKGYYNLLNQWFLLKNEKKSVKEYFEQNNYKTIAIYGIGELGCRLKEELDNSDIVIKYAIDKNSGGSYMNLDVLDMDDELEEVDVIIVTATFAFDEIEEKLSEKVNCPIISLEDVIYEL